MAGTTEDKLRSALTSKENIRNAIEHQGVTCGKDVPFSEYGQKILSIDKGGPGTVVSGSIGSEGMMIFGVAINITAVGEYVNQGTI